MTALAALLREYRDAVEADLLRFYGADLADLYRGGLSLRRLSVLIHYLPAESATIRARSDLAPGWDVHAFLLADLFHAFSGEPHPARPKPKSDRSRYSERRARLEAQRARLAARRASSSGEGAPGA